MKTLLSIVVIALYLAAGCAIVLAIGSAWRALGLR